MAYMSGQGGDMGQPMPYPLTIDTPRLYVSVSFGFTVRLAWRTETREPISDDSPLCF